MRTLTITLNHTLQQKEYTIHFIDVKTDVGFKNGFDGKFETSAHGKSTFFFCYYGDFQSMAELRCTSKEYMLLAILRAVNDAVPDESLAVGNFANNAYEDRGFFEQKQGCFSQDGKTGGF